MKNLLLNWFVIIGILFFIQSCEKVTALEPITGDISADDLIIPTFTIMRMPTGEKSGERIGENEFEYYPINDITDWSFENGDVIFYRGAIFYLFWDPFSDSHSVLVPLEDNFYWNGVCLYYNGFCYQITKTEDGLRIYNMAMWTLNKYCVIVQTSSNLSLPPNAPNTEMLKNIHKLKIKRGHLKAAKMNPNIDGAFTPAGLAWGYYKNYGKEIRSNSAGEYVKAEDFIRKTDAANGYFESSTSELQIKRMSILIDPVNKIDCSKVY